jgi:hypothetical protein
MYRMLRKFKGEIICNAGWLVDKLAGKGIKSELCFAGLDIEFWLGTPSSTSDYPLTIGCLYHPMKSKQWDWFRQLATLAPDHMYFAFGNERTKSPFISHFEIRPTQKDLRAFYEHCDIWFSPSKLEGFHNPPAEAALSGCLCICLDRPSAGVSDWASDETCHMVSSPAQAAEALQRPDFGKVEKAQRAIVEKVGTRERNMKRLVQLLGE